MPDTAPIPPAPIPPALDDRALRQLGGEHGALLEAYRALCRTPPIDDEPLDRLTQALIEREERVAGLPAHSVAGLLVRLQVLWAALDHTDASLFRPPDPGAGIVHRLVWGALEDARRLAGCDAPLRTARFPPAGTATNKQRSRRDDARVGQVHRDDMRRHQDETGNAAADPSDHHQHPPRDGGDRPRPDQASVERRE